MERRPQYVALARNKRGRDDDERQGKPNSESPREAGPSRLPGNNYRDGVPRLAADTMLPNGGRAAPVSIVDFDISTIDGQLIAQERVGSMARTLCDRIIDPLDLGPHEHYVQCVATATDQAMRQILAAAFARAAQVPPPLDAPANTSVQAEGQTLRAKVSLTDLDLSTAEGVRAAHERLHDVARRLCAQIAEESEISHQPNFVKCVGDAMATARVDVGPSSRTQLVGRNR